MAKVQRYSKIDALYLKPDTIKLYVLLPITLGK